MRRRGSIWPRYAWGLGVTDDPNSRPGLTGEPPVEGQGQGAGGGLPLDPTRTHADQLKLRARVLSALVLAPGALAAAWAGGPLFSGVIAAAGVINPLIAAVLMPISSLTVLSLAVSNRAFVDPPPDSPGVSPPALPGD